MFDKLIRYWPIIQKEILFLLLPIVLITSALWALQTQTLPLYKESKNIHLSKQSRVTDEKKRDSLLLVTDSLLKTEFSQDTTEIIAITQNSAMTLLFQVAQESKITINRSTPTSLNGDYAINLDFHCSYNRIIAFLSALSNKRQILTTEKLSLSRDRNSLRCSMLVRFFNCGDNNE